MKILEQLFKKMHFNVRTLRNLSETMELISQKLGVLGLIFSLFSLLDDIITGRGGNRTFIKDAISLILAAFALFPLTSAIFAPVAALWGLLDLFGSIDAIIDWIIDLYRALGFTKRHV
jgi:hypothetical protein